MISALIKPLIPIVRKQLETGKIEKLLDNVKSEFCKDFQIAEHSTIEYMITKQVLDDNSCCYVVVFVELKKDETVTALLAYKLSDVIEQILNRI